MKSMKELVRTNTKNGGLTYADLMKKRKEGTEAFNKEIDSRKSNENLQSIMGRSGIMPLHQGCTIENFIATTPDQQVAKQFASDYIVGFGDNKGCGFILSGKSGTGKNHIAAAICNNLMARRKTCLVATVSDLMIKLRKCYGNDSKMSEDEFLSGLIKFDLLVIDEIGLQRGTDSEKLVLNQVVDQRISNFKPTGMLTNLDAREINDILGVRIMDRMRMNGGRWIPFSWESHRGLK